MPIISIATMVMAGVSLRFKMSSCIVFLMLRTGSLLVSVCSDYSRIFPAAVFFMGFLMIHAFWMSVVWRPEW